MKKIGLLFLLWCFTVGTQAQELKAYQIYNQSGEAVNFGQMAKALKDYDVVLFGEFHNNSINHWLELQLTKALYELKGDKLILGAEMFERDNQAQVDAYLAGQLDEKQLEKEARLWDNFHTDYKPLLDFARDHELNFIATNVPRRYASMVAHNGLDTLDALPKAEKEFIANLPITVDLQTPGYQAMVDMLKKHNGMGMKPDDFVAAQAVKDATMAESIRKALHRGFLVFKTHQLLLHYNGNYHSKDFGGIYWHLKHRKKNLKVASISIVKSNGQTLAFPTKDYIPTQFTIVIPKDMTLTY